VAAVLADLDVAGGTSWIRVRHRPVWREGGGLLAPQHVKGEEVAVGALALGGRAEAAGRRPRDGTLSPGCGREDPDLGEEGDEEGGDGCR